MGGKFADNCIFYSRSAGWDGNPLGYGHGVSVRVLYCIAVHEALLDRAQIVTCGGIPVNYRLVVLHHSDQRGNDIGALIALVVPRLDPELHGSGSVGAYVVFRPGSAAGHQAEFAPVHRPLYGIGDPVAVWVHHRVPAQGELLCAADAFSGNRQLGGSGRGPVFQEVPVLVHPKAAAIQNKHGPDSEYHIDLCRIPASALIGVVGPGAWTSDTVYLCALPERDGHTVQRGLAQGHSFIAVAFQEIGQTGTVYRYLPGVVIMGVSQLVHGGDKRFCFKAVCPGLVGTISAGFAVWDFHGLYVGLHLGIYPRKKFSIEVLVYGTGFIDVLVAAPAILFTALLPQKPHAAAAGIINSGIRVPAMHKNKLADFTVNGDVYDTANSGIRKANMRHRSLL